MEPADFKKWRKSMSLSQKQAADVLGLKRRIIQYYEKGERGGEIVKIPLSVRLACYALEVGVADYRGPGRKPIMLELPQKKPKRDKKEKDKKPHKKR